MARAADGEEGEFAEKFMQVEHLKKQAEAAAQQLEVVMRTLIEMATAKEALQEISKVKAGSETLVPIGAGVYVKAKLSDTSGVFMGLGAETVVEKPVDECLKILDEQMIKIEGSHAKLTETVSQINDMLKLLVPRLEELSKRAGERGG